MKLFQNPAVYVVLYLLGMLPTYILPYFGSNSVLTIGMLMGYSFNAVLPFLFHLFAISLLVLFCWIRGVQIRKSWIVIFPILAGTFDLLPMLSFIPLIPTMMHIFAIITGVANVENVSDSDFNYVRD